MFLVKGDLCVRMKYGGKVRVKSDLCGCMKYGRKYRGDHRGQLNLTLKVGEGGGENVGGWGGTNITKFNMSSDCSSWCVA